MCIQQSRASCASEAHVGAKTLTVVYSAECRAIQKTGKQTTMLPILVVLFVFSYAILTMLVFEQGQTIESQRSLIREMLKDSTQLAALKGKMAHEQAQAQSSAPAVEQKQPTAPAAPGKEAKRPGRSARNLKEAPGKPASDLEDVRRSTRVI